MIQRGWVDPLERYVRFGVVGWTHWRSTCDLAWLGGPTGRVRAIQRGGVDPLD